jgi:hypothetical protein
MRTFRCVSEEKRERTKGTEEQKRDIRDEAAGILAVKRVGPVTELSLVQIPELMCP